MKTWRKYLAGVILLGAFIFAGYWFVIGNRQSGSTEAGHSKISAPARRPTTNASAVHAQSSVTGQPGQNSPTKSVSHRTTTFNLRSADERQRYADELSHWTADRLWNEWRAVMDRADRDQLGVYIPALGHALRRGNSPQLYSRVADILSQTNLPVMERQAAARVLEFAATPEAVQQLLEYARTSSATGGKSASSGDEKTVFDSVNRGISGAARTLVDGARNWAVSPVLEAAWRDMAGSAPSQLRRTVADAIAYLGRPEGVQLLIDSVAKYGGASQQAQIPLSAIADVKTNDSVSVMASALARTPPGSPLAGALTLSLVSTATPDSIDVVLNHLAGAQGLTPQQVSGIESLLIQRGLSGDAKRAVSVWLGDHPDASETVVAVAKKVLEGSSRPNP